METPDCEEYNQKSRMMLNRGRTRSIFMDDDFIDYSPTIFLRCHSKNNDSTDQVTSVWQCAFEPTRRSSEPNNSTNTVFATCGGNSICLINAEDGCVITKHYSVDFNEEFTALAWSSLLTSSRTINILAVAGRRRILHLLHPDEAVCFAEHSLKNKSSSLSLNTKGFVVESLIFHPHRTNILFEALRLRESGEIHVWDIGNPHPPDYESNLVLLQTFPTNSPATALTFSSHCNTLLCATEKGVECWTCPTSFTLNKNKFRQRIFKCSSGCENLAPEQENFVDSIEVVGNGKMIAFKCALYGCIYLWDLEDALRGQSKNVTSTLVCKLKWSQTDNYYMHIGINTGASILACGDDKGALWIYNIKEIMAHRSQQQECQNVIEWPDVEDEQLIKQKKLVFNKSDIVVNKVALNHDASYLVAVTSTNTVCVWKKVE